MFLSFISLFIFSNSFSPFSRSASKSFAHCGAEVGNGVGSSGFRPTWIRTVFLGMVSPMCPCEVNPGCTDSHPSSCRNEASAWAASHDRIWSAWASGVFISAAGARYWSTETPDRSGIGGFGFTRINFHPAEVITSAIRSAARRASPSCTVSIIKPIPANFFSGSVLEEPFDCRIVISRAVLNFLSSSSFCPSSSTCASSFMVSSLARATSCRAVLARPRAFDAAAVALFDLSKAFNASSFAWLAELPARAAAMAATSADNFAAPASLVASASKMLLNVCIFPSASETIPSVTNSPNTPETTTINPKNAINLIQSGVSACSPIGSSYLGKMHRKMGDLWRITRSASWITSGISKKTPTPTAPADIRRHVNHKSLQYWRSLLIQLSSESLRHSGVGIGTDYDSTTAEKAYTLTFPAERANIQVLWATAVRFSPPCVCFSR